MGDDVIAVLVDELDVGQRGHNVVLILNLAHVAAGGVFRQEALRLFGEHEIDERLGVLDVLRVLDDTDLRRQEHGALDRVDDLDVGRAVLNQGDAGVFVGQADGIFAVVNALVHRGGAAGDGDLLADEQILHILPGRVVLIAAHGEQHVGELAERGRRRSRIGGSDLAHQLGLEQIGITVNFDAQFLEHVGVHQQHGAVDGVVGAVAAGVLVRIHQVLILIGNVILEQIRVGHVVGQRAAVHEIEGAVFLRDFAADALHAVARADGLDLDRDARLLLKHRNDGEQAVAVRGADVQFAVGRSQRRAADEHHGRQGGSKEFFHGKFPPFCFRQWMVRSLPLRLLYHFTWSCTTIILPKFYTPCAKIAFLIQKFILRCFKKAGRKPAASLYSFSQLR